MDSEFQELLKNDSRYKAEAYRFVFESLDYAQKRLKFGKKCESEPSRLSKEGETEPAEPNMEVTEVSENHVTGQELCQASRLYALDMYGFMAKAVLGNWGIRSTSDIGELVYNMIKIGRMRKTQDDRREDFNDVFDFPTAFDDEYRIAPLKKKTER